MPKRPYEPDEEKKPLLPVEEMSVMSETEMTGLIAAGPQNEGELESYDEICHFLPSMTDHDQM
ncbi:MAG: hypothetical protein IKK51_05230 [Oscillospiraceae bacterium]|nr:hypothetical protein [Oscillospiraceae bacterium]MBR4101265.1 hypothetical protein [Oscillospiraceae bacterium]MBR6616836.1 hypothetical protein [Oscillospiraceae bacterium]